MHVVTVVVARTVWESGVHALKREQILGFYENKTRSWKEVGGEDRPMIFFDPAHERGTWEIFAAWLYGDIQRAPAVTLARSSPMDPTRRTRSSSPPVASPSQFALGRSPRSFPRRPHRRRRPGRGADQGQHPERHLSTRAPDRGRFSPGSRRRTRRSCSTSSSVKKASRSSLPTILLRRARSRRRSGGLGIEAVFFLWRGGGGGGIDRGKNGGAAVRFCGVFAVFSEYFATQPMQPTHPELLETGLDIMGE